MLFEKGGFLQAEICILLFFHVFFFVSWIIIVDRYRRVYHLMNCNLVSDISFQFWTFELLQNEEDIHSFRLLGKFARITNIPFARVIIGRKRRIANGGTGMIEIEEEEDDRSLFRPTESLRG